MTPERGGPFKVQKVGDCYTCFIEKIGMEMFCPGQMKRETPEGAANRYASDLNGAVLSWLKSKAGRSWMEKEGIGGKHV